MASEVNYTISEKLLWNFYIVDIPRTSFEDKADVPPLAIQMVPIFLLILVIEGVILYARGMKVLRLNQGISTSLQAMMTVLLQMLTKGSEFYGYLWLYQYRIISLDWSSPWTWFAAAIGVDFCAYWLHRMFHEINFLWSAGHQVHHSSEDYNITASVRQSGLQKHFFGIFCLPLALLGVPLAAVAVHIQFNVIFQVWVHTELITTLGPLDWIFSTPTHHQVHHGTNNWCLDKNYGFVLIIWDRIFGTFQEHLKDDEIVYGLVTQPQTFQPFYLQTFYLINTVKRAFGMDTFTNFLKGLFYGPGWTPGEDRLGAIPDMTKKPEKREKYDPKLSNAMTCYLLLHFALFIIIYFSLFRNVKAIDTLSLCMYVAFLSITTYSIGVMLDGKFKWLSQLDLLRCTYGVYFIWKFMHSGFILLDIVALICMTVSSIFWMNHTIKLKYA